MKCILILSVCVLAAMSELTPDNLRIAEDMCKTIPDLSILDRPAGTFKTKLSLLPYLKTVCAIYRNNYPKEDTALQTRGLLDSLSGLMGDNSKLSTLLKAADALSKAKGVFDEVKKLAPDVHDHLKGSISDVHDGLQDLIDSITKEFVGTTVPPKLF